MTFEAENTAIESKFHDNWAAATPVKYDNVDFTPPGNAAFVELQIHNGFASPISTGGTTLYRSPGIISINIYLPLNTGTKTAKGYTDTIAAIFRGQQFSGIICRAASVTRIGELDGKFVYNVSIPFFRDETF